MKFTRNKTDEAVKDSVTGKDSIVWSIELDGEVVGRAYKVHKTATQYSWNFVVTVNGTEINLDGVGSCSKAYRELNARLGKAAPKAARARKPAVAVAVETEEVTA